MSENEKLVNAKMLLETIWPKACRPSLRWLRKASASYLNGDRSKDAVPCARVGRRVYYSIPLVMAHLLSTPGSAKAKETTPPLKTKAPARDAGA